MRMCRGILKIAISIAFLIVTVACADASEKPSRAACIAGIVLDFSDANSDRQTELKDRFSGTTGDFRELGLAAVSVHGDHVYFQFRKGCDSKQISVDQIMTGLRRRYPDMPGYARVPVPIEPSPQTIEFSGRDWRD